jgi:hypothetical protein
MIKPLRLAELISMEYNISKDRVLDTLIDVEADIKIRETFKKGYNNNTYYLLAAGKIVDYQKRLYKAKQLKENVDLINKTFKLYKGKK